MKGISFFLYFAFIFAFGAVADETGEYMAKFGVESHIKNGTIKYFIYDTRDNFMNDTSPYRTGTLKPDSGAGISITFGAHNKKNRDYAVKVHHDVNDNGIIDEGDLCGYSNNVPHWDGAKFNTGNNSFESNIKFNPCLK
ncbi:MAG: DUF2141 domain-containing protein [Mucispirillum sp.]|nr:DUF2141 domain-containing protein [Mucispirillum sp.]